MTTTQIDRILSQNKTTRPLYRGVFPYDLLPRFILTHSQKPALIVVNHGSSQTSGTHWTLLYFPKSLLLPAYYFDSLGNSSPIWDLDNFILRNSQVTGYTFNRTKLQDDQSSSCGHFVIVAAWLLARGVPSNRVHDYFTSPHNDCFLRKMIKQISRSYLVPRLWLS